MKIANIIIWTFLFILIALPSAQGVRILYVQDTNLSGCEGDTVNYIVRVENDERVSVDIQLREELSEWEVKIYDFERTEVESGEIEEFIVDVKIPTNPENKECVSKLRFYQKYSYFGLNYSEDLQHELTTSVQEEEKSNTLSLILISSISLFFIGALGYLWYGRKYFLLAPLYTNIPKEKLLDHENRKIISNFLSENNGSRLSEISNGTGIHLQTLRHHMKLFEQSNFVTRKEMRYFIRKPGSDVIDTDVLSPVLQRLIEIIQSSDGVSISQIVEETNRSKPWIGNRIHDLLVLDLIEIVSVGRFKYIYPKGQGPIDSDYSRSPISQSLAG